MALLLSVALSSLHTRRRTLMELERILGVSRAQTKQVLAVLIQNNWCKMIRAEGLQVFSAII